MRWFKAADPVVQSVSSWASVAGLVLSAIYSIVGFLSPAFKGLHWTLVVFFGVVLSIGTLLALAIFAALCTWIFRQIKPLPSIAVREILDAPVVPLQGAKERQEGGQFSTTAGEISSVSLSRLSSADRERISVLIREVVDFVDGDLQSFQTSLVRAICGSNPPDIAAVAPLLPVQIDLEQRAHALHLKHSHYSKLIEFNLLPLYQNISGMGEPMKAALDAETWPPAAQAERCARLNTAFSELGNTMTSIDVYLAEKHVELLNSTEVPTAEQFSVPLRLSRAEKERVTDRLIKLDDYLTDEVSAMVQPLRDLLGWQEHLRHVGAGQLNSEIEALRQPIARQIRNLGHALVSYQADTDVLGLNPMAIKTKFVPINDALRDFTDVTQALAVDSIHWSPLVMPGRQLANVVADLIDEIDRVRRDIGDWRKKIAQGQLD